MKKYKVKISDLAKEDIREIFIYIRDNITDPSSVYVGQKLKLLIGAI